MASKETSIPVQHSAEGDSFQNSQVPQSEAGDSIISSRMTDIVPDDGGDEQAERASKAVPFSSQRRGSQPINSSRPNTGVTGVSSQRGAFAPTNTPRRSHVQRGSGAGLGTIRPPSSSTTKSHVPSLTSHAFFRPMSSQRLQAQRGGSRPATMAQQVPDDGAGEDGNVRQSVISNRPSAQDDADGPPPPSRGTEFTEQEALERRTANTSPSHGHNTAGSLSESVRPLQRGASNSKGLSVNIDKRYKNGGGLPTPLKSPRSFRSSFLLPNRGDAATSPDRSTDGREKLASVASSPGLTPVKGAKPVSSPPKTGGNYEYFTGNTVFCWGGRLQNTRHQPINIATGILVATPAILFFIFSAPWLWHNISPAIPIVFGYIFYICMSSFIHASLSDPGILPRNLHPMPPPDENEDPLRLGPPMNDWTMIKSAQSTTSAMEVPTKYCKTCNIWRPPRGHHCRICDNCIETQDHHCVWINNCVGRRNYRYFFTFLTTSTFLGLFLLASSLAQILIYQNRQSISFGAAINHFRVPFAMVIYGIIATIYPAALMGYHLFLMGRGETTREYLNSHKFLKKDRHRPFTQGNIIKNWFVVLCRPRPPTYLNFKRKYEEGDQRFGDRRGKRTAPLVKEIQGQGVAMEMEMQDVPPSQTGFQGPSQLRVKARP